MEFQDQNWGGEGKGFKGGKMIKIGWVGFDDGILAYENDFVIKRLPFAFRVCPLFDSFIIINNLKGLGSEISVRSTKFIDIFPLGCRFWIMVLAIFLCFHGEFITEIIGTKCIKTENIGSIMHGSE